MEFVKDVRRGMLVTDSEGQHVGTLADWRAAEASPEDGLDGPDVPEPERGLLRKTGYIKIEGSALSASDCYVSLDRIQHVSSERLQLTFPFTGMVTG